MTPVPPPILAAGMTDRFQWKNRLQEYTQGASKALPVYRTFIEGPPHAPQFRSRVWVDGVWFSSPNAFLNKKMAEQDVASHALIQILEKVKSEDIQQGHLRILENTNLCKSIVNEYAMKINVKPPTYTINSTETAIPMFTSYVELNGATYVGQTAKCKKEAEHLAARSAILAILGSKSNLTMSEILKSKFKFYDSLKKGNDLPGAEAGTSNAVFGAVDPSEHSGALLLEADKKNYVYGGTVACFPQPDVIQNVSAKEFSVVQYGTTNVASGAVEHTNSGALTDKKIEAYVGDGATVAKVPQLGLSMAPSKLPDVTHNVIPDATGTSAQSLPGFTHVFKKPKMSEPLPLAFAPPTELMAHRIEFVHPAPDQAPVSGKKKNRRKKKAKKIGQLSQSQLAVGMIGQSSVPSYPVPNYLVHDEFDLEEFKYVATWIGGVLPCARNDRSDNDSGGML